MRLPYRCIESQACKALSNIYYYSDAQSSICFPQSLSGEVENSGFAQGKCSGDDIPQDLIIQLVVDRGVFERAVAVFFNPRDCIALCVHYIQPARPVFKQKSLVCKPGSIFSCHGDEDVGNEIYNEIFFLFFVLKIEELKNENALLRAQLQQHGIEMVGETPPQ